MRWEDQEINHKTCDDFPEVICAFLSLVGRAERVRSYFVHIDQPRLDDMIGDGRLIKQARGARIDRLCLYCRLMCRLGPGGDDYSALGAFPYWSDSESLYGIVYISPKNDWFDIMVVVGEAPIQPSNAPGPSPSNNAA
jgi:hypothetical protein